MFLEEFSIWIFELSKSDDVPNVRVCHPIHWGFKQNKKGEKGWIMFLCLNSVIHLLSLNMVAPGYWALDWYWDWTIIPLILMLLGTDWIILQTFLVVQLADGRPKDFLASMFAWPNPHNKSSHIFYWFCLSREPWVIRFEFFQSLYMDPTIL